MSTLAFVVVFFAFFGVLGYVALRISNAITSSAAAAAKSVHRSLTGLETAPPGPTQFLSTSSPAQLRAELLKAVPSGSAPGVTNNFRLTEPSPQDLVYTYGNVMDESFTAAIHIEPHPKGSRATVTISGHTEWDGNARDIPVMRSLIDTVSASIRLTDIRTATTPMV